MDEQWLPVVGYEGFYEVSNTGRVRALARSGERAGRWRRCVMHFPEREMKISTSTGGYKYLSLKLPDRPSTKYLLHRLVMRAFVGEPAAGYQVNHKDGDKANNNLANLEYCTAQENLIHLTRTLKRKIGGSGGYSKLTETQARAILADKRILREIAADYGISLQAVWNLQNGKTWAHLQPTS